MGFSTSAGVSPSSSSVIETPPPTVTETQVNDTQADYAQRTARKRGLLSTILSNRNRSASVGSTTSTSGGNTTLG